MSVCAIAKQPLAGVVETSGRRTCFLYWPVITQLFGFFVFWGRGSVFFSEIVKCMVLHQHMVDNEGVSRGRSVAVGT